MKISSTRRKFLAGLGLGAASPLLTSIAGKLVGEAWGQTGAAPAKFQRLFMFTGANGLLERFTLPKGTEKKKTNNKPKLTVKEKKAKKKEKAGKK